MRFLSILSMLIIMAFLSPMNIKADTTLVNEKITNNSESKNNSEIIRNYAQAAQAIITGISLIFGGWWAFRRFVLQREGVPHIEFTADINVIGKQNGYWVIELISTVENKGKARQLIHEFYFDVYGLKSNDSIKRNSKYGGQIDFPHEVTRGSHMPATLEKDGGYFFIEPSVKAKYSYILDINEEFSYVIYHSKFKYKSRNEGHTAEKTILLNSEKSIT